MLTLALDTTTRAGSVAITDDDRVLAVLGGDATRTHGERLPGEIERVLDAANLDRSAIDLLVVASGPGAFTGLRIGLAAMQGLAMTLGTPIVGVSALDALAWTAVNSGESAAIATWMDAQRGEVFSAVYPPLAHTANGVVERAALGDPEVGPPQAILAGEAFDRAVPTLFVGDGARRYEALISDASPDWRIAPQDPPLAPALAWLGRRRAGRGLAAAPHALQPLYVRRPDAEIERDRSAAALGRRAGREGERP